MSGNQALNVNSVVFQHASLEITNHGSDWLYTVSSVMGASTLALMGLAFTKPQSHRIFHYITAGVTAIATISYFAMGSNLGQVPIQAEFVRPWRDAVAAAGTREIFYVRYIDWFVTAPLLILDVLLTAGVPTPTILVTILASNIMVVCGLVGALTKTTYKWGFFTFGCAAFFFVVYQILIDGRKHANALGGAPKKAYTITGAWLVFIWFIYPIAWGLCEGGNVIHPDSEAIFYGVLDIMAKPVFGFLLVFLHKNINPADIGLAARVPGDISNEKFAPAGTNPTEGPGPNVGVPAGTTGSAIV